MALQVRLRHALGERIFELPEQPAAEPLIVGRGMPPCKFPPLAWRRNTWCCSFMRADGSFSQCPVS
jgi:hypothetical protein